MEISIESCRICLRNPLSIGKSERWEAVQLSDVDLDQISYAEKYNTCTGIKPNTIIYWYQHLDKVSSSTKYGQKICMKCICFLRKMYTFLKICVRTEKILQKHIAKEEMKNVKVKVEPKEENLFWENEYFESFSPQSVKMEVCEVEVHNKKTDKKQLFNVVDVPDVGESVENNSEENYESNKHHIREKDEESYICEICGNVYKKKYLLEKHLTTHSDKKEFECEICKKTFSQQQYLSAHIKRHSGVRKYSCSFCSRKFYAKGKLTEHERVHRGERIYKCKFCDSSFFYGHNLKRHQLCHLGLKPFLCKHCHKTFRTKSNLDQHFKTDVHKDESTRMYSVLTQ